MGAKGTLRFPDTREYSDHVFSHQSHVDIPTEIIPDGLRHNTKDVKIPGENYPTPLIVPRWCVKYVIYVTVLPNNIRVVSHVC